MSERTDGTEQTGPAGSVTAETLAQLVGAIGDGVIIADHDGVIIYWNAAAERIFGWTSSEAVGQSLDLIIPTKNRSAHWSGYRTTIATGTTRYGDRLLRVPALHRAGHRISIAFTVALLTIGAGRPTTAVAAVVRDETERWSEERSLRRRVEELSASPGT